MGFLTLFEMASMPVLQVLIISTLGAFMATGYLNLLTPPTQKSLNKIVFMVFTPSLMFASLAETVTFRDLIAWWFMPVNLGLTFLLGGMLGWIAVKLLKPKSELEGLIIATCSAGNLGGLMLIIVPAICREDSSPFGDHKICSSVGLSYASFSMALGNIYIWTYTYQLVRSSALKCKAIVQVPNKDLAANGKTHLLLEGQVQHDVTPSTISTQEDTDNQVVIVSEASTSKIEQGNVPFWGNVTVVLLPLLQQLLTPPTLSVIVGFFFGAVPWLKNLIIGDNAPLRVIQDSIKLLGDGTVPCLTLMLGGNLTKGLRMASLKPIMIVAVICVRYVFLPLIGIGVVNVAGNLGFLPSDPLYRYVLLIQFAVPPAMNIDGDEFEYPMNPNLRYSRATVNTMRAEWEFRKTLANVLVELCREVNLKFPRRLAMRMPTDTPQLLQRALHRIRDEVNHMTQRLQRSGLMKTANERAEDGLMDDAHQYYAWSMDVMYESDNEMSDDDDNE